MTRALPTGVEWLRVSVLGDGDAEAPAGFEVCFEEWRVLIDGGVVPEAEPDLCVVTHAHTNATAALDTIVSRYPDLPVVTTAVTSRIAAALCSTRGLPARWLERARLVSAIDPIHVDGLRVALLRSGHLPGAISPVLDSGRRRVVWAGDVCWMDRPACRGASSDKRWLGLTADMGIVDGTLLGLSGLLVREKAGEQQIVAHARAAHDHGGAVLFASSGCGRAQDVLAVLHGAMRDGQLPVQPVWVDSLVGAVQAAWPEGAGSAPQRWSPGARLPRGACLVLSTRMLFPGTPSSLASEELKQDPRNRIVITGGTIDGSPADRLLRQLPPAIVDQIPFADHLTEEGLGALKAISSVGKWMVFFPDAKQAHRFAPEGAEGVGRAT